MMLVSEIPKILDVLLGIRLLRPKKIGTYLFDEAPHYCYIHITYFTFYFSQDNSTICLACSSVLPQGPRQSGEASPSKAYLSKAIVSKYNIASKHFAPRVGMKRVKAAAAFSMHFVPLLSPFLLQLPSCSIQYTLYVLLLFPSIVAQRKSHIWSNAFIQYIHKSQLYTMYMYLLLYMLYMHAWLLPSNQLSQTTSNSPNSPLPYQSLVTTTILCW